MLHVRRMFLTLVGTRATRLRTGMEKEMKRVCVSMSCAGEQGARHMADVGAILIQTDTLDQFGAFLLC
jgi:hypothetical protein